MDRDDDKAKYGADQKSMSKKKILIVEDDAISLAMETYRLKQAGYAVVSARDGISAVAAVRTESPDLILLDLGLPSNPFSGPVLDGFAIMEWLNRVAPQHVPIIVVTARNPSDVKQRVLDAGAVDFIQKPVDFQRLFAAMQKALGGSETPPPPPV